MSEDNDYQPSEEISDYESADSSPSDDEMSSSNSDIQSTNSENQITEVSISSTHHSQNPNISNTTTSQINPNANTPQQQSPKNISPNANSQKRPAADMISDEDEGETLILNDSPVSSRIRHRSEPSSISQQ